MIATFIKTRLQIKSYVIHFIDHRDLMFPNMLHLAGALPVVLYLKVSSSTWGVARFPICINRGDKKYILLFRL